MVRPIRWNRASPRTRAAPGLLWGRGAMSCAAVCQCRPADQCGNTALAPESFLDVAGAELHVVDGGAVRVELLRGLSSQGRAGAFPRRHYFFPSRHSLDGGAGLAAAPDARRVAHAARLSGFHAAAGLVDLHVRLCGPALDLRGADA